MTAATSPLRVLLSAYACEPGKGSEPGVGWNWVMALLRRGYHLSVITRANNRSAIERACAEQNLPVGQQLQFIYYDLPRWAAWWKKGSRGVYPYYGLWQRGVLRVAAEAHRAHPFDVVHHLTFGVWRRPSQLYKLGVPFMFGPLGGGDSAPPFLRNTLPFRPWVGEWVREWLNALGLLNPTLRVCLRRASLVVCKTPETASWVERAGGRADTVALEIGIDARHFITRTSVRNDAEPLRCLYAGRLIGLKGIHLAIAAIAGARRTGADVRLTIVGDGPMRRHLERLVQRLELEPYVRFMPSLGRDALFQQYREHDVLLFPSLHDSSGNVVLEAMAHGLPVVCLKLGGPGVLVDESCGHAIVPQTDNVEATVGLMADALRRLHTECAHWIQLRDGALAKAAAMTWEAAVARIYEEIPSAQASHSRVSGVAGDVFESTGVK